MSDEESFVILGSTPTPSMEAYSSVTENYKRTPDGSVHFLDNFQPKFGGTGCDGSASSASLIQTDGIDSQSNANCIESQSVSIESKKSSIQSVKDKSALNASVIGDISIPESIAEKYLLGKVGPDEVKSYVSSMFPSFGNATPERKDMQKLHQLVLEHELFKNQILTMNSKFEDFLKMIQHHEKDMQMLREENSKLKEDQAKLHQQNSGTEEEIKKIREENQTLRHEMEALKIHSDILQKDQFELTQKISEGKSVMGNMSAQMQRLEIQQQDISLLGDIPTPASEMRLNFDNDRKIKNLQDELSTIKAMNLEFQDMKKIYIDEINCLKVNLVAAEELLKQAQTDINLLKAKDIEKTEQITRCETENHELKQSLVVFKQQWEVYRTDFETERNAREQLAGEKDQLLTDLKLLQRRNQQLLEENEKIKTPTVSSSSYPSRTEPVAPQPLSRNNYVCPICSKAFHSLGPLELHVQNCY